MAAVFCGLFLLHSHSSQDGKAHRKIKKGESNIYSPFIVPSPND